MSKPFIVVGDKIDHGGAVASSTATTDINGLPVARINDKVACSQHGDTLIVSGDSTTIIDGQPVARHGDKTACGATLIAASQIQVFLDSGGGGGSGPPGRQAGKSSSSASASAGTPTLAVNDDCAASGAEYDEQIQFVNANGAKLAGVHYRVKLENGEILQGTTDVDGRTARLTTVQPTRIVSAELSASRTCSCSLHAAQSASAPLRLKVSATTNATQLGSSTQQVATPAGNARGLTSGEIAMARLVFADAVDYTRVKVHNGEYLWLGMQPDDTAMTPNGEMYFNPESFQEDFSATDLRMQRWFMHEMAHVWQFQLGYPVKARGAIRIGLSYDYVLASDVVFSDYNMEAQGEVLSDYFLVKFRNAAYAVSQPDYRRDSRLLAKLESALQHFLRNPSDEANLP